MYASTILKKWGCIIEEAENGQIALEKIRKSDFEAILMDIHMPILDGIEASRTICTTLSKPKSETPIVAFTANALKGDKDRYLEAGMNAYISKPFMPEELYKILVKYYTPVEQGRIVQNKQQLTNLSNLRKMSNNDEQFVNDMIETFITNTPEILDDMNKALAKESWKDVGALAHKLKPNLAFMGIDSLQELVINVEKSGKTSNNLEQLPDDTRMLVSKVREAIEELAKL
jgi:CheY-like chemotaxis protein